MTDLKFNITPDQLKALHKVCEYLLEQEKAHYHDTPTEGHIYESVLLVNEIATNASRRCALVIAKIEEYSSDVKLTEDFMFRACVDEVNAL
jgi:hypothetical protein